MIKRLPPNPNMFRNMQEWARQFYDYYLSESRIETDNDPLPVLLPHRTKGETERATTDGILLYDPVLNRPVFSINGQWVPMLMESDVAISQFGELLVAQRTPLIELSAYYGTSLIRDVTTTTGSASITKVGGELELSTGATATSMALLESAEAGRYISGFGAEIGNGMRIPTQPAGNEFFEWGGVDAVNGPNSGSENGFWFGYDATGMYVAIADAGTVTKTYQPNWNIDTMDGSNNSANPSGLSLDPANGYIYQIEFTYYGHGEVVYEITRVNPIGSQRPIKVHATKIDESVSVEDPSFYLFQEANNGGDASDVSCFVGGRSYTITGIYIPARRITSENRGSESTSTTLIPLVTFKRKSGFLNRALKVDGFDTLASGADCEIEIILNGSLTGASYGAPDGIAAGETACEVDIAATAISGGISIYKGLVASGTPSKATLGGNGGPLNDIEIPRDQPITLCARTVSGTGDIVSTFRVQEEW